MTRTLLLGALLASAVLLAVGGATRLSSAAFTTSLTTGGSSVTADELANHFSVTPGADASGGVDTLAIDLGSVASPRTVTSVFTVTNTSGATRTARLTLPDDDQLAAAVFASSGAATVTLAPGASSSVSLTTSAVVADASSGTLRLGLSGSNWLYRDYSLALVAAPAAPASLTATAGPARRIDLDWPASTTTQNLAGYDVYRSNGGSWTKRNASLVTGTSWSDTSTTNGTEYSYRVRAISAGGLQSLDSATATARADSSAPTRPSSVALANGGGNGNAYINIANASSISVNAVMPSSSVATDTVTLTLTRNGVSVSATLPATAGAGTVAFTGIDASSLPDGSVTISATTADAAGNVSSARTATATKDTVAPGAPTATYNDRAGQTDRITGTAEGSAAITAVQTLPSASGPYTANAASGGSYTVTVARVDGTVANPITVTYLVTARDAAGNTGAATTLVYAVTR